MRSLPASLRSKPLRQLVRSRKPSAALQWIPWDDVIMLTSFLLSCQGLRESFYWPLRQSKTKQAEIENWMFMDRNPVMLWFNFTSAKDDCFCNLAVWLTETQEKKLRGKAKIWGKKWRKLGEYSKSTRLIERGKGIDMCLRDSSPLVQDSGDQK